MVFIKEKIKFQKKVVFYIIVNIKIIHTVCLYVCKILGKEMSKIDFYMHTTIPTKNKETINTALIFIFKC